MSGDIVKRLRESIGLYGHRLHMREAADEIERLRAELAAEYNRREEMRLAYEYRLTLAEADRDALRPELAAELGRVEDLKRDNADLLSRLVRTEELLREAGDQLDPEYDHNGLGKRIDSFLGPNNER